MLAQMPSGESELDPPLDTPVRAATVPKIHARKILVLVLLVAAVVPAFSQPDGSAGNSGSQSYTSGGGQYGGSYGTAGGTAGSPSYAFPSGSHAGSSGNTSSSGGYYGYAGGTSIEGLLSNVTRPEFDAADVNGDGLDSGEAFALYIYKLEQTGFFKDNKYQLHSMALSYFQYQSYWDGRWEGMKTEAFDEHLLNVHRGIVKLGDVDKDGDLSPTEVVGTPSREEIEAMNPNYTKFKFPQVVGTPSRGEIEAMNPNYTKFKFPQVVGTPSRREIEAMNPNYTKFKFPQILNMRDEPERSEKPETPTRYHAKKPLVSMQVVVKIYGPKNSAPYNAVSPLRTPLSDQYTPFIERASMSPSQNPRISLPNMAMPIVSVALSQMQPRCKWNVVTYTNCPKSSNAPSCGGMKSSNSPCVVLLRNKTAVLIIMMITLMAIVWLSFEGTRASRISLSQKKKVDVLLEQVLAAHRSKKFVCDRNRENPADFFQTRTCRSQRCARNAAHGKSIGPRMGLLSALAVACICVLGLLGSADAAYDCSLKADCYYESCADRPCSSSSSLCNNGTWDYGCDYCSAGGCGAYDSAGGGYGYGTVTYCPDPQPCAIGTYSTNGKKYLGDGACKPCEVGTYSAAGAATSCPACIASTGRYCPPGSNASVGTLCPSGFYCTGGSNDKEACGASTAVSGQSSAASASTAAGATTAPEAVTSASTIPASTASALATSESAQTTTSMATTSAAATASPSTTRQPTSSSSTTSMPTTTTSPAPTSSFTTTPVASTSSTTIPAPTTSPVATTSSTTTPSPTTSSTTTPTPTTTTTGRYCPPGSTASGGTPCPTGFYCTGGSNDKQACPSHSNSASGMRVETDCICNAGSTGPNGSCVECVAGKYKIASGDAACSNCSAGQYSTAIGATSDVCQGCPPNSHAPEASNEEIDCTCNVGSTGRDGGTCSLCVAGKYKMLEGREACQDCGIGTYSTSVGANQNSTCLTCPVNSNSSVGSPVSTNCTCNAGSSGPDGGTCSLCVAGKYKILEGREACQDCEMGTYSASVGANQSSMCLTCPVNSNSSVGSPVLTNCTCNAGSSGPDGGPCAACPTNSDSSGGNATCACNAGSTGPDGGVCSLCVAGKYKIAAGDAACQTCPTLSDAPPGSNVSTACACNAGATGRDGGTCSLCVAGKYKALAGSTACVDCEVGTYSALVRATQSLTCVTCPTNADSSLGSSVSTACTCNSGSTGPDGGTCTSCGAGTFKPNPGAATCDTCPSNSISPVGSLIATACTCNAGSSGPDGGTCTICESGKYTTDAGAGICQSCPSGKTSIPGITSFTKCSLKCPAGSFGPDGGPCDLCSEGTFKTSAGPELCTSCPSNTNSQTGSNILTRCTCNDGYPGPDGGPCTSSSGSSSLAPPPDAITASSFVVTLAVSLPLTLSDFDDGTQSTFKVAMAAVTGVSNADVSIDNIESISTARRGLNISIPMRRLLAEGVRIDMSIKAADKTAADSMHVKLTVTVINTKLQESGLPAVTILEAPKSVASHSGKELNLGIVGAIGGAIGLAFLGYIYIFLSLKPGVHNPDAHTLADSGQSQPAGTPGKGIERSTRPPAQNVPSISASLAYGRV